jgi:NAD(P)-dependent dehydrogenase (short-subunit alcohol dehydrogenase family)
MHMTTPNNGLLTGKTYLVTGSSRGIGYETAAGLACLGA